MAKRAYSTIGTKLYYHKASETTWTQLAEIKSFPDLGGKPEKIQATTLQDKQHWSVLGVQSESDFETKINLTPETYAAVKALEGEALKFRLDLGSMGKSAFFDGELIIYINGGEVNGLLEATIAITPSTEFELDDTPTT